MIRNILFTCLIFLTSTGSVANALEPECVSWFMAAKIDPSAKICVMDCAIIPVDMGTFTCPLRCDELCHPQKDNCDDLKRALGKRLKEGRPRTWERKTEASSQWNSAEKSKVLDALTKLPPKLRDIKDAQIYRMKSSVDRGNPASTLESSTILYDQAFSGNPPLTRILAHELAHQLFNSWTKKEQEAYEMAANWFQPPGNGPPLPGRKPNEFVQDDGISSPEEDFANNVEEALFNDGRLKKTSPGVHRWLHNYFGDSLKLGGPCDKAQTSPKIKKSSDG